MCCHVEFNATLLLLRLLKFYQPASSNFAMAVEEEDVVEPEYDFSSIFEDMDEEEVSETVPPQAFVVDADPPSASSSSAMPEPSCGPRIKRRRSGQRVQWKTGRASWQMGLSKLILMAIRFLVIVV